MRFRACQPRFSRGFGASQACLGRIWGALDQLLGALGRLLGPFSMPLGRSWSNLASLGAPQLEFIAFWVPPDTVWEAAGGSFRHFFRRQCGSTCREPGMAFACAFRSPLAAQRYVRSTWNWSHVESSWTSICDVWRLSAISGALH